MGIGRGDVSPTGDRWVDSTKTILTGKVAGDDSDGSGLFVSIDHCEDYEGTLTRCPISDLVLTSRDVHCSRSAVNV